jgi:hypothetical protein
MIGALERAASPRRRFDTGGPVDGADDTTADGQGGALSDAAAATAPTHDAVADPSLGALSRGAGQLAPQDQDKATAIQHAMAVLQAGRGNTNLPMLAAAGALLAPTRTGGFSESVGNAFSAAVPAMEAQRKLETEALLRQQQMEMNQEWRQAMVGVRQQHENAYGSGIQARSIMDIARASYLQARANAGTHATTGDVLQAAATATARSLLNQVNPDTNKQYTPDEAQTKAYQTLKGLDIAQERADNQLGTAFENQRHHQATEGQADQRLANAQAAADLRRQALAQAQTTADKRLAQIATDSELRAAAALVNSPNNLGGKLTLHAAIAQVRNERLEPADTPAPTGAASAPGPAPQGAADPLAAARAAISAGAPRDAVIQRLRDNGIDPSGL